LPAKDSGKALVKAANISFDILPGTNPSEAKDDDEYYTLWQFAKDNDQVYNDKLVVMADAGLDDNSLWEDVEDVLSE
jgi:hypothetical protein